ncbi:MAG: DUF2225 domain-containing protein [Chloroflexota bacterium]
MPVPVPESYSRLAHFSVRLASGATLYEQGTVPDRCYVVLRGQVAFEVLDHAGERSVVGQAGEGELVGHVAAFTGRPTSAMARADGGTVVIAIPFADLPNAFRLAPELALELLRAFADPTGTSAAFKRPGVPPPAPERARESLVRGASLSSARNVRHLDDTFDEEFFFVDTMECPISGTVFDYLRVRTKAVRPVSRDSDFYVRYKGIDPALYSLIVCPGCGYTAYRDDFDDLTEEERTALWGAREERLAQLSTSLCGLRTLDQGVIATDLAMACYGLRRPNERRHAVLQHRRAWAERERGDTVAELKYLDAARQSYQTAFEKDSAISDESAARAAYLIGDLWLRLGEPMEAARWLETAVRVPEAKSQTGLIRMARERLYDARELLTGQKKAS